MSWPNVSTMSSRVEFVALAGVEGANIRALCRRFGISPKTGYKWIRRAQAGGAEALADRSRRPTQSPAKTPAEIEQAVLDVRQEHPTWGGRKLRRRLQDLEHTNVPSASTITAVLRRHERLGPTAGAPRAFTRFEAEAPNRLWQMDFKGHFATGTVRCHPLTVLDDHSRFALALRACAHEQEVTVRDALVAVFRVYGLPDRVLCDNGSPWGTSGSDERHTGLSVWLLRLGVGMCHGRPYHPQTQGKDERFHRTLKVEVLQGHTFRDLAHCQTRFDAWREVYNTQRPHERLGLSVPGSRYRVSARAYPEQLPELEYGTGDAVRKVQKDGMIGFGGRWWKMGKAFIGQRVGVRPTATDGVYGVYFGTISIAEIDQRVGSGS